LSKVSIYGDEDESSNLEIQESTKNQDEMWMVPCLTQPSWFIFPQRKNN